MKTSKFIEKIRRIADMLYILQTYLCILSFGVKNHLAKSVVLEKTTCWQTGIKPADSLSDFVRSVGALA
ncbi:hypothetical protein [Brenneria goodwinii]|nr:hypothetical protein [Brenneria goodwinii]RLM24339.1 hypothetical protein BIY28_04905 [Brenneria goodwinii]